VKHQTKVKEAWSGLTSQATSTEVGKMMIPQDKNKRVRNVGNYFPEYN
jgi:hypothetical protein